MVNQSYRLVEENVALVRIILKPRQQLEDSVKDIIIKGRHLIIDDEIKYARNFSLELQKYGADPRRIYIPSSRQEAERIAINEDIALVTVDNSMGSSYDSIGGGGLGVVINVKTARKDLPMVMITSLKPEVDILDTFDVPYVLKKERSLYLPAALNYALRKK